MELSARVLRWSVYPRVMALPAGFEPLDGNADPTILGTPHGRSRYRRWDGSQRLPDFTADELLDEISDDLLTEGDLGEALRRLLNRGMRGPRGSLGDDVPGLRSLLERLARQRKETLERYQLTDVLSDVKEELDAIVDQERRGIERRMASDTTADVDESV